MPNSLTEAHIHYVWATWDRQPLITPELEGQIYDCIRARCREMQCHLLAIGGMPDHIHVLVRLPATLTIAEIAKDIKGASGHLTAGLRRSSGGFKWQGAYGAFAVCTDALDACIGYIENQKQHHARKTTIADWERASE